MLVPIRRTLANELMDAPDLDAGLHREALRGLARLNRMSVPERALWRAVRALAAKTGKRLRLLDVACGSADVGIALVRRAAAAGVSIDLVGLDASATAVGEARRRAGRAGVTATFERGDALAAPLPTGFDVVMCSLFLHHLNGERAVALLRAMASAARCLVLVDDLARTRTGLAMASIVPPLVTRSRIVHIDARRSVRAAFTAAEAAAMASSAGLRRVSATAHWPQRFLLRGEPVRVAEAGA